MGCARTSKHLFLISLEIIVFAMHASVDTSGWGTPKSSHRSLPYKSPLSDSFLRDKLNVLFEPIIAKSALYTDLGSSQACEYANRAAMLKAPKYLHYGESESLDFRIQATAASINVGRKYLSRGLDLVWH